MLTQQTIVFGSRQLTRFIVVRLVAFLVELGSRVDSLDLGVIQVLEYGKISSGLILLRRAYIVLCGMKLSLL